MKKKLFSVALCFSILCSSINAYAMNLMENITPNTISEESSLSEEHSIEITDFSIRLFQESFMAGENTLISPLSVLYALSMTGNGANGNTLTQIEEVLGLSIDELNHILMTYTNSLQTDFENEVKIANSIWFTDDEMFTVQPDFLQINADFYNAGLYQIPFDSAAPEQINQWINEETDGLIDKLLDTVPSDAVMYLINALAFQGKWAETYEYYQVSPDIFTKEDGTAQSADYMYSTENYYIEDSDMKGFLKHYAGNKYAFLAILPNETLSVQEYVSSLTGEKVADFILNAQNLPVDAAIPKFESSYDIEMSTLFQNMGMTDAFHSGLADFSALGSFSDGNLFINRILHKTYLTLDEYGTKAAAATAVEICAESACEPPENPQIVHLDRPFVYMLVDCEAGIPLFVGSVMEVD